MFPLHKETEYERQYSASTPSSRHQSFSHDNVGPSITSIPSIPSIPRIARIASIPRLPNIPRIARIAHRAT